VMWCISVVKRTSLLLRATSRTPSKPIDARIRLCVRGAGVCPVLPLAARLPSRCSADTSLEVASLFATFLGVGSEEARLRAGLRPPPKLHVQFSRMQLSQRCTVSED
jgi:hypothetical protein